MSIFKNRKFQWGLILGTITVIATIPTIVLISCGKSGEISSDQKDVNEVMENFKWEQDAIGKDDFFPEWPLGKQVSLTDLGTKEPEDIKEATITYKVVAVNQEEGTVYVKTAIRKNRGFAEKVLTVNEFQTIDVYINDNLGNLKAINQERGIVTSLKDKTASEAYRDGSQGSKEPTLEDMGVKQDEIFTKEELKNFVMTFDWGTWDDANGSMGITLNFDIKYRMEYWDFDYNEAVIIGSEKEANLQTNITGFKKSS